MLTVREALKLPSLASARLVAGETGLDRPIRWVHIVDLPEPSFEWAKGGELLLTSGVSVQHHPERGEEFVRRIADRDLAGIVLSIGYGLDQVPEEMQRAADERGLPLIEAPPQLQFIDVTEEIFTQLVNQEQALRAQAEEIHESLMDLVLEGDSLQEVASALANILQRSITVENETFDVLAEARVGPVDEARKRSVAAGRTSPALAERLLERGIYDRLLEERRPLRVPSMPDLEMDMERIVAPIIVAHQIMGYVWIIAGDRKLTELDELAIDHAATVAALLMLKDREVQDAELQLQGDLLDQLLQLSAPVPASLVERVHQHGFQSNRPYQVMVIEGRPPAGEALLSWPRKVERWLTQETGPALVVPRDQQVVVVLQPAGPESAAELAHQLVESLTHPAQPFRVGLGRTVDDLQGLKRGYSEALEALEVETALGRSRGVASFSQLGFMHWLHHLPQDVLEGNAYLHLVRRLEEHDVQHDSELMATLGAFLEAGSRQSAAADLNIHRNTLSYRLERIEAILNTSLEEPKVRQELRVALAAHQLSSGAQ